MAEILKNAEKESVKILNKVFTKNDLMKQLTDFLAKGKPDGYSINFKSLDNLIRFETGRLCVITGVPGHGKSEIVDFFNLKLNELYGWKCLYFSPENHPSGVHHLRKLLTKYIREGIEVSNMVDSIYENDINYLSDNFYFLNYEVVCDIDSILNEAQTLIDKENIKILTIDPYNRLEHQYTGFNETQYISLFLDKLTKFAQKNDILINLIAHPTKQKEGEELTGYSICGSHNFYAKADYMYSVKKNLGSNIVEFKTIKIKFKSLGSVGKCELKYDYQSGNYYEIDAEKYNPFSFIDTLEVVEDSNEKQINN